MISIPLYVNHYDLVAGDVDSFTRAIEEHVVRKFSSGQSSNDFPGVRVKDDESRWLTAGDEKAAMGLVHGYRRVSVYFAQRPGGSHLPFLRVDHRDGASVSDVGK